MQKATFTNSRGQSVSFSHDPPFVLSSIEGLGDVTADVQTQKAPYQDGSTPIDVLLEERIIPINFTIVGNKERKTVDLRRYVASVLNPKLGLGKLEYELNGDKSEISACPESVPFFPSGDARGRYVQSGSVELIAPNPYWQSESITEEPTFEPLFEFPFEGEFEMGIQRDRRIIINDGDAPAPLQVEFHGPALNPVIINNTTGEFIKINQELLEGERMMIDTSESEKSVYFVGENGDRRNVFNWLDLDSTFFKLEVGENEIEYSADNDIQGAVVNISYSKLYTAV